MDIECTNQIKANPTQYMWNSGKFFGQMGLIQECMAMPSNNSYFMANFINDATHANASLYIGMCLPAICSNQTVKRMINTQLANHTEEMKKSVGAVLSVGTVDVNPQNYTYEYQPWFYVTVVLMSLLVAMSVLALVKGWLNKKQKYEGVDKVVQSFNLSESMKIFTYKSNYLNVFNGIKTICMFWVIFGHQFSVRLKYDVNIEGIPAQVQKFFYLFVVGAFLAVDVFFFIGGFLVAYSFMRQKSKSVLKYPMAIIHRLLRFWPSYIMTILIYYSVYIHTGSGPLWKENNTLGQVPYCAQSWKTLLFVDNLVDNGQKMCMGWGWYLQNDMQIFVFSMLFVFLYTKNRMAGYISLLLMIAVGVFFNIYEVIDREILQVTHLRDFVKWNQYFINIYIKPWIRCPPYIVGLIFGLLHMEYLEVKKKLKQSPNDRNLNGNFFVKLKTKMLERRWMVWLSQFLGVALMLTTIILPHHLQLGNTWPQAAHAIYLSMQKITFTLGVYLLIIPSLLEIPNITFFLMDTKFFNFTGKISFWTYLIHFMIVEKMSYQQKVDFYYTPETILPIYTAIAAISLFFGFIGTILVEVPFAKLEKMLFSLMMKKGKPKKENNESIVVNNKESINVGFMTTVGGSSVSSGSGSIFASGNSLISNDSLQFGLLKNQKKDEAINASVREQTY